MYKYETHLHTFPVSRCAKADIKESLDFYKKLGYDGVFITNHFLDGNINIEKENSYEDKIEFWNNDILYEKFMQSCHYLWICELLKEKFDIELTLREFRYSGVSMEDDFFESMELRLFYPVEFKKKVENILTNPDIVLEYTCESW